MACYSGTVTVLRWIYLITGTLWVALIVYLWFRGLTANLIAAALGIGVWLLGLREYRRLKSLSHRIAYLKRICRQ